MNIVSNENKILSIFNSKFIVILLLVPYFEPKYFSKISVIDNLYIGSQIVVFVLSIFLYILYGRVSKFFLVINLYFIVKVIITLVNNQSYAITYFLDVILVTLPLVLLIEIGLYIKPKILISSISFIFTTLILINFIFLIILPNGLWIDYTRLNNVRVGYFLGIGNQLTLSLIPGITVILINSYMNKQKITIFAYFMLIVTTLTVFYVWSGTAIITVLIFILLFLLAVKTNVLRIKYLSYIYIFVWITFIWYRKYTIFQFIIEDFLGKNMTLSNRTLIWDSSIDIIQQSLFFGYGHVSFGYYVSIGRVLATSHNVILQVLLEGGIISLLVYVYLYIISIKNLEKFKNSNITKIIGVGIFSILVSYLTEAYIQTYLIVILAISFNVQKIILSNKLNRCQDV